ncbi:GNAT family N-acetyltransferase [Asanoa sp. NPDC049518]|uniref:GNAT family N-acetyltransferase n=1 Tax=unclassified Asanoa TaxID=2685164 RepID=UPI00341534C4
MGRLRGRHPALSLGPVVGVAEPGGEDRKALPDRTGVFLKPEHRGTGVIGRLFDGTVGWMRQRNLTRVRLYVHADNVRARRAYEKVGFTSTGRECHGSLGPEIEMARAL